MPPVSVSRIKPADCRMMIRIIEVRHPQNKRHRLLFQTLRVLLSALYDHSSIDLINAAAIADDGNPWGAAILHTVNGPAGIRPDDAGSAGAPRTAIAHTGVSVNLFS